MNVFQDYADYYDIIYDDKNYLAECKFVETIFKKYSKIPIRTVLDVGCGTGGHALILSSRGYKVTGVDISSKMIDIAKEKGKGRNIRFIQADLQKLNLGKKFDTVVAMFAVMSYQVSDEDLKRTFTAVRKHLKVGGLFVFDFWFGPAVLAIKPEKRIKEIESGDIKIIRFANQTLDEKQHTIRIDYKLWEIKKNFITNEVCESHTMRYIFREEIEYYAKKSKFKVLKLCSFMKPGKEVGLNDWSITCILQAI